MSAVDCFALKRHRKGYRNYEKKISEKPKLKDGVKEIEKDEN